MDNEVPTRYSMGLLENGLDFVLRGIDELFDDDSALRMISQQSDLNKRDLKYGILHVYSGFLLLLKERLYRHLPELIYKGKVLEIKADLEKGKNLNTIDLDEILERLQIGPRITFSNEDLNIVRRMQNFRNQIEHYKVDLNLYELWKILTRFLCIVVDFLFKEIGIDPAESTDELLLKEKIRKIETYQSNHEEKLRNEFNEQLKEERRTFDMWREDSLIEIEKQFALDENDEEHFMPCDECGQNTLIATGNYAGICINKGCFNVSPVAECDRCGTHMVGYWWETNICENCYSEWMQE